MSFLQRQFSHCAFGVFRGVLALLRRLLAWSVAFTASPVLWRSALVGIAAMPLFAADEVLLSELKVNPPGPTDGPFEFIELRGTPGASLSNMYVLVIEGDDGAGPGKANMVVNLGSSSLGNNGLLLIAAPGHPYEVPGATTLILDNQLADPNGGLDNGTTSFLLVNSPAPINEGVDLDNGNDRILEGLPPGTVILDAIGWWDGGTGDIVYAGVVLTQDVGTPDAATRFPGNRTPLSASAWFNGNLTGSGSSFTYNETEASHNYPPGSPLTPGASNNTGPTLDPNPLPALCGVIGDPTNPRVLFTVGDAESAADTLVVTATSSNALVVPDANLFVTAGVEEGDRILTIEPVGVGYSHITLHVSDGVIVTEFSFAYAASEMGRPNGVFHMGGSDGSTAIAVDNDYMFVADDENQTLRLFRRRQSGYPVWQMDFNPFLALTDIENGRPREVDMEASTRVGNRLFWMGGHSHANIGEGRTNRTRVFVTDLSGTGAASTLNYVGRYEFLKLDLVDWDQNNRHGKGEDYYGFAASTAEGVEPKAANGFNIEGLAMMPSSTSAAFLGFRAPIVPATNRLYTLVVPVLNFTNMALRSGIPGSAQFGTPIELDLGGRGIRSIEGTGNNYMIIGGPPGDIAPDMPLPRDFKLYTWTGNAADRPQERAADLSGLNPEGIIQLPPLPWTATTEVEILSDNGRTVYYGDGVAGKQLPVRNFKKCRSDVITLGDVVTPQPYLISITPSGPNLILVWRAVPGLTYQVQYATALTAPLWTAIAGDVVAASATASKTVASDGAAQRFYRVILVP
jgi:hypothetical protein